jgi:hypothetical protein
VTAAPPFDGANDKEIMENVKKLQFTFDSTLYFIKFLKPKNFLHRSKTLSQEFWLYQTRE